MRRGMTLIEVLVAIFVMGIGLIAILALFPIGILRMAQAIQDGRTGSIGATADAIATIKDVRHEPSDTDFKSPGGLAAAPTDGPSYPVFIDPAGYRTSLPVAGGGRDWLGATPGIPRRSVSFVTNTQTALRWFTFLDDIYFDRDGTVGSTGTLDRDFRYSWAFLVQRPRSNDASIVNLSVVVFNRRSLALSSNLDLPEQVYAKTVNAATDCNFDITTNVVTITHGGAPPTLRPGDWILDGTLPSDTANVSYPHGYFYRVVSVSDNAAGTAVNIEVQTPLRGFTTSSTGRVIVLDGVAEVFEKGVGRLP